MRLLDSKKRGIIAPFVFFFLLTTLNASFIIKNDNILPKKAVNKIEELGKELYKKTRVSVYLAAVKSLGGKNIKNYEMSLSKKLKKPFILLTISINDKKIDIINSSELDKRFDKEQVLSPFPWSGTILPLLTARSKNPKANIEAALLNGYADIVEQVANSYNIKLSSAIGSQNKIVYNIIKVIFYGILFLILIKYFYRRIKKNE